MTAVTQGLGLLSTAEAAAQLGVDPCTVRQWRTRGYITPVAKTRDGRRLTSWYRSADVWACARARLSPAQVAAIRDVWAEVDELVAESCRGVSL